MVTNAIDREAVLRGWQLVPSIADNNWQPAPSHTELPADEVHVWRVALDRFGACNGSRLDELSEAEHLRASRFRFAADRKRFLGSHTALRSILATYLDAAPRTLEFGEGLHGKPLLRAPLHGAALRFSLTHSGSLALVAVTRGREVGVDIEHVRPVKDVLGVAASFFSPKERDALARIAQDYRLRAFLATWVLKEAYLKACGEGLLRSPNAFDVTIEDNPRLLQVRDRPGDETRWSLRYLDAGKEFVAALAAEGLGWRPRRWVWSDCRLPNA